MSMLDLPSLCSAHARTCSCNPQKVSQELLDLEVKLRVVIIKSEIFKRSNTLELVRLFTCSCQAQFNPAKPDAGLLYAPDPFCSPTLSLLGRPRSSRRNHHPRELCQGRICQSQAWPHHYRLNAEMRLACDDVFCVHSRNVCQESDRYMSADTLVLQALIQVLGRKTTRLMTSATSPGRLCIRT